MNSIAPSQLQQQLKENEAIILVDVRELYERNAFNIGGLHIPLDTIFERLNDIPKDKMVVLYCQKGIRSGLAIQRLHQRFGYNNLINLSGGMDAWKNEINV